jgi:hypothetical protein
MISRSRPIAVLLQLAPIRVGDETRKFTDAVVLRTVCAGQRR